MKDCEKDGKMAKKTIKFAKKRQKVCEFFFSDFLCAEMVASCVYIRESDCKPLGNSEQTYL
jgi:hypothetical protein